MTNIESNGAVSIPPRITALLNAGAVFAGNRPRFAQRQHLGAAQGQLHPLSIGPVDKAIAGMAGRGMRQHEPGHPAQ